MKKNVFLFFLMLSTLQFSINAQTTVISQGFDDITLLPGLGWVETNMSTPVGLIGYFQGSDAVFPAYMGAPTSYLGVNFNSVAGASTISNWMITPQLTLQNGDIVSFWSRGTGATWPDRLQFRLNTLGTTNLGADANSVGDFGTLLIDINPTLAQGGYPAVWTQYTATITGLSGPTNCRLAFRYYVTNGGPSGSNSDYIGIDEFSVTRPAVSCVVCPPGAVIETETCGNHTNDGYDMTGAMFEPLTTGNVVCGTIYANSPTDRDFDWYSFTVTFPEKYQFKLIADNDMHFQLLDITTTQIPVETITASACDTAVIEKCLLPGIYAIRLLSVATSGISCSGDNAYVLYSSVIPAPQFMTAGSNSPACMGDTLYLWAAGALGYMWEGPDGFSSNMSNPNIPDAATVNTGVYNVGGMNADNCVNIISLTVDVVDCTFISETTLNSFAVYPNPAVSSVRIRPNAGLNGTFSIQIISETGQIVSTIVREITSDTEFELETPFPAGKYSIRMIDDKSVVKGMKTLIIL